MAQSIVRSVLPGILLALAAPLTPAAQAPQPSTSPALSELFLAAKNACDARRHAECIAKAREVLASARQSADDRFAANSFIMRAAQAQNDQRTMIEAMEAMLDSGFDPGQAARNQLHQALASAHFRLRNYPQAIRHGTELIRAGAANEDVYTVVGQSYYQTRNYPEAIRLFGDLVSAAEKAGRRPDRNQLNLLYSAYDKAGNADAAQATLEKLVRFYPTADTWLVLLYEVKREKLDPRQRLQVYRLMESTGNLREAADVMAYYEAATTLKLHHEAHRVLAAALKRGVFARVPETERKRAERYVLSARGLADADRAALAQLEAEARSAPTGDIYVTLGMQRLAFEMYPQAIEALKAGLARGGVKNAVDAQMTLGIAQLKAGQKAEAVKTFRAIQGGEGITRRIIKFWTLHAQ
jgi:tetratricopeptide (TPR) repeat protein